jgi:hypothetical protein
MLPELDRGLQSVPKPEAEYRSTRILTAVLPPLYGPRGQAAVALYRWLRWVDDVVDENLNLSRSEKLAFLERQRRVILEEPLGQLDQFCQPAVEIEEGASPQLTRKGCPKKKLDDSC